MVCFVISLRWRRHNYNEGLHILPYACELMAIEKRGFFKVFTPTVLRGIRFNGHIRGSVTITPDAERFAVELSLPVFTTKVYRGWD